MRPTLRDRLNAKLTWCPDAGCDCLLWSGRTNQRGYGLIYAGTREQPVHRVAWELYIGPIPDGLHLDHVHAAGCRHKTCCNLAHLEPVTLAENNRRAADLVTHCPKGHKYTPENTRIERRRYSRHCLACRHLARRPAIVA